MQTLKKISIIRFSPFSLLFHGLCIVPAFLLQEYIIFRIIQTLLFLLLSLLLKDSPTEKRRRIIFSLLSSFFIVLFNIFSPHGEVFIKIISFPITKGAILTGILKATTFTGLLSLSRITVMRDLTISGPIGGMTGKVFFYFERLKEIQGKHKSKDIFKRIDMILLEVLSIEDSKTPEILKEKQPVSWTGILLLCISGLFHWGLLGVSLFVLQV